MWSEEELLKTQHGVIAVGQAELIGLSRDQVRHRARRGSWLRIHPGVYLTHAGDLSFVARVWAALLNAGPTALASHRTAGRLQGLVDEDPHVVDVTIAESARRAAPVGITLHRSLRAGDIRHPARSPAQTRVEETILDLVAEARTVDDAVGWLLRGCQRRLTTPPRLAAAVRSRPRLRHRDLALQILDQADLGVASPLERRYRNDVELAHGLPRADRAGAWTARDGRRRYYDVRYAEWRLRVELEGLAFHPDDRSWVDQARDNAAVELGDVVLRYGWRPVRSTPCAVAAQVAAVLTLRGWSGRPVACGPTCSARPVSSELPRHR